MLTRKYIVGLWLRQRSGDLQSSTDRRLEKSHRRRTQER